jgi:hypothetical protein
MTTFKEFLNTEKKITKTHGWIETKALGKWAIQEIYQTEDRIDSSTRMEDNYSQHLSFLAEIATACLGREEAQKTYDLVKVKKARKASKCYRKTKKH